MTDDLLTEYGATRGTSQDDPSGAAAAREAYDAGAVDVPHVVPVHQVMFEFRVQAEGRAARALVDQYAALIAQHPAVVDPVTVTVAER